MTDAVKPEGSLLKLCVGAALALVATAGCVTEPDGSIPELSGRRLELESIGGLVLAELELEHPNVVQGENIFRVSLDPLADEAAAAVVGASAFMPAHGHGTSIPVVTETDGGYRVSELMLFMPGRWEVTFDIEVGGSPDELLFVVNVE